MRILPYHFEEQSYQTDQSNATQHTTSVRVL
jgi:hypothetical protein